MTTVEAKATLQTYRLPPFSGAAPNSVVIFLHGLGDSGSGGLLGIGQVWQKLLPQTEFLCPDAPFPFDMGPPGFSGRQWFSLQDSSPAGMAAGVREAAPILDAFIDHVLATRQLRPNRLALVGFSQGTMMALHVAPRRPSAVAAVVGYSGMLVGGETLRQEKRCSPPVLLVHGMADDVVPYSALCQSELGLKNAGITVESVTCPGLGHSIDDAGIASGVGFLQQFL